LNGKKTHKQTCKFHVHEQCIGFFFITKEKGRTTYIYIYIYKEEEDKTLLFFLDSQKKELDMILIVDRVGAIGKWFGI
jgi:hypothetical protein